jgi:type IV pilus assembly protein PilY1
MTVFRQLAITKFCAAALAAALVFQSSAIPAATITPSLSQNPLPGLVTVKPNIMFTLDDSGSMSWEHLPDYVGYVGNGIYHCRESKQCGGATASPTTGYTFSVFDPPIRSSDYNPAFYNALADYTPGKKSDGTSLPCEGADTTCASPWTSVYSNGYVGYPGANSSTLINLATGYPDTIWCWKAKPFLGDFTAADKATADGNGSVCRRNGRVYSKVTVSGVITPAIAAGYNYPNNSASCVSGQTCLFINSSTYNGAPYYYTISKVQYCSANDAAGWGTSPCVSDWDATTYKYVRYGTLAATFDPKAFTRVDIKSTGILVNGVAASNPSGRTYATEMANFAIWYSFYRTRVQAMQAAAGIAFSALDQNSRVGLHTLHENSTLFTNIADFTTANKTTWFTRLYAAGPDHGTPLPDAVWRIGELFSGNIAATGLPGATDPLDPATGKCQANYHLLSTDGYWNSTLDATYTSRGDSDKTVPALANLPGKTGFTVGSNVPRPYYEGSTATSDSLADLAMYYWIHDLRPSVADKVADSVAPWQHVTLYGLSIGARGSISYPSGINAITAGTANWPPATGAGGPEAIDDLWHAAINTRGKFFNAKNGQELAESVVTALADFTDASGTGAAVGLGGNQLSATNKYAYKTSYEKGWWGDVAKYAVDITTGVLPVDASGNPLNPSVWSAATQLDAQAAVAGGVNGWDANRRIVTINNSTFAAVPFRLANLSAAQKTSLNSGWSSVPSPPTQQEVLDWLRGDQSNEGVGTGNFRLRTHILGDIVYSGAVPVGAPNAPYLDTGAAGSPNPGYNAFKSTAGKGSRAAAVYVGGNDGMLHAFADTATYGGQETWAYVPMALFSSGDPNDTAHTASPAFQLGSLTYRRGGIPLYSHKFYVNATPRVWDIDFANTNTSTPPATGNDWRTILVGGLGVGGRAVYALDVTDPVGPPPPAASADTEATAATKVLWEYTEANLGYVYDAPTLVKTYAYGWVVLVASGYNNPGGKGFLYVLNPKSASKTGQLLKKIALPSDSGTDASPTGLGTIRAYAGSRQNPYALQAYGGDLKGNVWRFDLSNPDATQWKAELIATLKDAGNKPQPITTGVRIEIDQNNNVDRYLFVGTGKLLDNADLADTSVSNTMYVIKDGDRNTPEAAPATPYSRTNLNKVTGTSIAGFSGAATGRGWYQDAANSSQKINSDVYADANIVVFAFSEPSTDPCEAATKSTLFARDLTTGNSVLVSGGSVVAGLNIDAGIAGVTLIQGDAGTSGASAPVLVQITTMKGQIYSVPVNLAPGASNRHRFSWGLVSP